MADKETAKLKWMHKFEKTKIILYILDMEICLNIDRLDVHV